MRDDPDDARTRDLLSRVNAGGRFFLTSCRLAGRLVIRVCLLSFRCDEGVVASLVGTLRAEAART